MSVSEALFIGFFIGVSACVAYAVLIFLPEIKRKSDKISSLNGEVAKLNLLLRLK